MLAKDIFEKIGFTAEMIEAYNKYRAVLGDEWDRFAREYMREGRDFNESRGEAREKSELMGACANMVYILECTGYAYENFMEKGISEDIFYNTMCDITYKVRECKKLHGVYGIFVPEWFKGFLEARRFGLGRLQYDLFEHREGPITVGGFTFDTGAKTLAIHIPSSGPLLQEDVIESLKMAYEFFPDRIYDGVLFCECFSWLFFPPFLEIFKECSPNTYNFSRNFYFYSEYESEKFDNCWRVFNVEIDKCAIDDLPEDTRMQRGIKKYMQTNNRFGGSRGALLFDGQKILTRKED